MQREKGPVEYRDYLYPVSYIYTHIMESNWYKGEYEDTVKVGMSF